LKGFDFDELRQWAAAIHELSCWLDGQCHWKIRSVLAPLQARHLPN